MFRAKDEVAELLRRLPDDSTLEEIQYHLYVLEKVRRGVELSDAHGGIPQEEVESRLSRWLTK